MAGSTISTTVTSTVLLGGADYPSPLTITGSGTVDPAAFSVTGVLAEAVDVRLLNEGRVTGGTGDYHGSVGGIGVDLRTGGDLLSNTGSIRGGSGNPFNFRETPAGQGGNGVDIVSGRIANAGIIAGGAGGYAYHAAPANGGDGVSLDRSTLSNSGTILGGAGGYGYALGGAGIDLGPDGSVVRNTGVIVGGVGGGLTEGGGYTGGVGVGMLLGGTLINGGTIDGGAGGYGFEEGSNSGSGGAGLEMGAGNAFNRGSIIGGHGGAYNGYGGDGVLLDGGTLTNFGTIAGGEPGQSGSYGGQGDAVQFGTLAATLIVHAGAVFDGQVAADTAVDDVLRLAGADGTLSGLGTQFTGFTDITENAGATWTLAGANTLDFGEGLRDLGELSITGTLAGGAVLIGVAGSLSVSGSVAASIVHFATGGGGTLSIGAAGSVTSTLTGFGSGDVIDVGRVATSLSFHGGTLGLENGTTTVETLALAGGYTAADFHLAPDGHDGTEVTFVPPVSKASEVMTLRLHEPLISSVGLMTDFHSRVV